MSIFDTLMGAVEKHPELNQEQHSTLLQTAMQMFGNHAGLSGLMNNAESQGIGNIFQSWVSTGANQSIAPQQVQGLVGQDKINELAQRVGVPPAIASAALARILPADPDADPWPH